MIWYTVAVVIDFLVDVFTVRWKTADKDLEILLLRQQLRVLERNLGQRARPSRWEKCFLAVLLVQLKQATGRSRTQLGKLLIFKPQTILNWHRELMRRQWTFQHNGRVGRPPIAEELRQLVIRLAHENTDWGYDRIADELLKLGYTIDSTTVKNVLKRAGIVPAPERRKGSHWRTFLRHYKQQMLACDLFTIETAHLKTLYVLFFIELGTRQVHCAGCTEHPNAVWVTQQARQVCWHLEDRAGPMCFLIHDNDTPFTIGFDAVFQAQGLEVIHTPFHAPNANAFAERWIRSVRQECLDKLVLLGEWHVRRVLAEYVTFYNTRRPHQGLVHQCPVPLTVAASEGIVQRRDILGGIIHDYVRTAA
jgi:putative transposase